MPPQDEVEVEESDNASENEYETKDERDEESMPDASIRSESGANGGEGPDVKKPKLDPKDPLRPRRKKARRACFACQRAHLTCGDERPCQRCIKRGLADQCQDGVRKKAKYLHDAPPEALRPVLGPNYNPGTNGRTISHASNSSVTENSPSMQGFFGQDNNQSPNFMQYQQQMRQQQQMPPPMQEPMPFLSQQSPISPQFAANQQIQGSMHQMSNAMVAPDMKMQEPSHNPYAGGALFDPSNPALFNFDLDSLNFGNHYGAMEFSMLNHMSSGAAETPPQDSGMGGRGSFDAVYGNVGQYGGGSGLYGGDGMLNEYGLTRQDSSGNVYQLNNSHRPLAYAIESGPISNPSPSTDAHASPQSFVIDASPKQQFANTQLSRHQQQSQQQQIQKHTRKASITARPAPKFSTADLVPKERPNTDRAYGVTEPYSYTTGFHKLTDFVRERFSAATTLKIAKSLASIRPSFISCTQGLNRQDLVFMEQCFQRTLLQLEEFMQNVSTPTLVCRRSGEVAAVNKEFTMMTGWSKDVLLGRAPNLNINTGKTGSERTSREGSLNSTGRAGLTTPRMRGLERVEGRPTYVLLAELLDDDAVVDFYEDFARLAFGDSRGSVSRRCKILKYKAKELDTENNSSAEEREMRERERERTERKKKEEIRRVETGRVPKINGEFGIGRLEKDGKLDCAYCWTVKRDVFDIPMMIVMNFLPCV